MGQQKNYKNLFKAEMDNYTIMNYEYKLEEMEECFLLRHKAAKRTDA